jgi:hypothetical protein
MDAQLRLIPRPAARRVEPGTHGGLHDDTGAGTSPEPAEAPRQWRIDDTARERGRVGISRAREALRQARRPVPGDRHSTAA